MPAETRLAIVLFGSFVLWFPALSSVLEGDLDAGAAGIRWGVGAAFVWLMVTGLHQLIASYAMDGVNQGPRRRAEDIRAEDIRASQDADSETDDPADELDPEQDRIGDSDIG